MNANEVREQQLVTEAIQGTRFDLSNEVNQKILAKVQEELARQEEERWIREPELLRMFKTTDPHDPVFARLEGMLPKGTIGTWWEPGPKGKGDRMPLVVERRAFKMWLETIDSVLVERLGYIKPENQQQQSRERGTLARRVAATAGVIAVALLG